MELYPRRFHGNGARYRDAFYNQEIPEEHLLGDEDDLNLGAMPCLYCSWGYSPDSWDYIEVCDENDNQLFKLSPEASLEVTSLEAFLKLGLEIERKVKSNFKGIRMAGSVAFETAEQEAEFELEGEFDPNKLKCIWARLYYGDIDQHEDLFDIVEYDGQELDWAVVDSDPESTHLFFSEKTERDEKEVEEYIKTSGGFDETCDTFGYEDDDEDWDECDDEDWDECDDDTEYEDETDDYEREEDCDDLDEDESEACNKKQTQTKTTPSRNHSTHKGEKMNTYNYWLIELSKDAWDLTKAELGDRHTIASRNKSGALKSKLGDLKAGELVLAFEAAPVSHVAKVLVVESARDQVNSDIYRDPVFKIVAEIPSVSLDELKEKMPDLHKRIASPAAIHCLSADDFQGVMKLAYCK